MNSIFFRNDYFYKMDIAIISMLKNLWITRIFLSVLLLSLLIFYPVLGEISSTNSSSPVWSDHIGEHRTIVSVSGDGNYVIAGSDTGFLRFYAKNGTILWTYRNEGKSVRSVTLSRSGDFAGAVFVNGDAPSSFARGEVFVYNRDGDVLWNYAADPSVEWISMSDDGNSIYVSGTPSLYSFCNNGTVIGKNILPSRIWALDSARDGSFAVAGSKISGHQQKSDSGVRPYPRMMGTSLRPDTLISICLTGTAQYSGSIPAARNSPVLQSPVMVIIRLQVPSIMSRRLTERAPSSGSIFTKVWSMTWQFPMMENTSSQELRAAFTYLIRKEKFSGFMQLRERFFMYQ